MVSVNMKSGTMNLVISCPVLTECFNTHLSMAETKPWLVIIEMSEEERKIASKDVFTEEESDKRIEQIQELIQEKGTKKQHQSHVRTD
ncbi:unnamed protein product [Brassica oleracea var. botrytis]